MEKANKLEDRKYEVDVDEEEEEDKLADTK